MPTSAQDTAMAEWVRGHLAQDFGARAAFYVSLQFGGDAINLGDVATGRVKNLIDCLYPVLGGRPGAPEDWRIEALQVEKGGSCEAGSVHIRVWAWPGESGSLEHLQHAVATEAGTDGARLQQLLAQHLAVLLPPVQAMREGNSIIMSRSAEFELCIAPDRLWMQTVRTRWDGHTPVPEVDRELWLRLESRPGEAPESAALRVTALVQIVFGERLASYTRCEDCGNRFPPEQMTDAWCHGCAHRHGIVY